MKRRTKKKYTDRDCLLAMNIAAKVLHGSSDLETLYSTLDWLDKFRDGRKQRLRAAFSDAGIKRQLSKLHKKLSKGNQATQQ